jgi:2-polyprenyl-6-hydroxyphenyl methylase/3-demethylubiquinone-9 3-methyltransferase
MASIEVNNEFYDNLGEAWFVGQDHPIALLRAEARLKNPWVAEVIGQRMGSSARVLDIGCGGGFLSNDLAARGYRVTGLDASAGSLRMAEAVDQTKKVEYVLGSAFQLPFGDASFDVCACMDVLEHVRNPQLVVQEAVRVLKPGGLFLFHTFNRHWLAKIVVIYGMNWFFKNVPKSLHLYSFFIKPRELKNFIEDSGAHVEEWRGLRPRLSWRAAYQILRTGEVPDALTFEFCRALSVGYVGYAVKKKL